MQSKSDIHKPRTTTETIDAYFHFRKLALRQNLIDIHEITNALIGFFGFGPNEAREIANGWGRIKDEQWSRTVESRDSATG